MKSEDLAANPLTKSGQCKRAMRESVSDALPPANRHVVGVPPVGGQNPAAYMDGARRCVTGATLLEGAASEGVAVAPRQATDGLGALVTVPSGNDSCFAGGDGSGQSGARAPILPEGELPRLETGLISPMPCSPPANGRPERFSEDLGCRIWNFPCLDDRVACDAGPLRPSLDIDSFEEPLAASRKNTSYKTVRAKPCGGRYR